MIFVLIWWDKLFSTDFFSLFLRSAFAPLSQARIGFGAHKYVLPRPHSQCVGLKSEVCYSMAICHLVFRLLCWKKSDSWFSLYISIPKFVPFIAYCAKYIIVEGCTVASSFWHLRRFVHYAWLLNVQSTISSYFYIHLYLW